MHGRYALQKSLGMRRTLYSGSLLHDDAIAFIG